MKLIYIGGATMIMLAGPSNYLQSDVIERDRVEVIYLPNNTCHIKAPPSINPINYQDYVRACMNNQHLRLKINNSIPN